MQYSSKQRKIKKKRRNKKKKSHIKDYSYKNDSSTKEPKLYTNTDKNDEFVKGN